MQHLTYDHEGKRTPGTWRPALIGDEDTVPLVRCPGCGQCLSLRNQRENNLLSRHSNKASITCPKCGLADLVTLHCWPLAGFPIKDHF